MISPDRLANLKACAQDMIRADQNWDRLPWYTKKDVILYKLILELCLEVEHLQGKRSTPRSAPSSTK